MIDRESMLKGLRREIKEELNIDIKIRDLVSKVKRFEGDFTLLAYKCEALSPIISSNDHNKLELNKKKQVLNSLIRIKIGFNFDWLALCRTKNVISFIQETHKYILKINLKTNQ